MYKTTAEKSKEIRQKLKDAGIKRADYSIKSDYSSFRINIKNLSLKKDIFEKILNEYESIDYCEASGEILQGGNTFCFVEYDWEILNNAIKDKM